MGLYPLDLATTVSLAWALVFYNRLPTRFYRFRFFVRPVFVAAALWCLVALIVPRAITHYFFGLGMLTLGSAWLFQRDELFRGRMWLAVPSALSGTLGVVFILAETLEVYPSNLSGQVQFLAGFYLGAIPAALALVLFLFTRREATEAPLPVGWVKADARLLLTLILLRGTLRILSQCLHQGMASHFILGGIPGWLNEAVTILVLPSLGWLALRRISSPTPSRSGPVLLSMAVLGFLSELAFLLPQK